MRLTPLDVRKQEFGRQMRGYDQDEVRGFLDAVADEYEAATRENKELQGLLSEMKQKLQEFQQMESNLKDAAVNATKAARDAEDRSSREADMLLQGARLESEQIIADSRRKHQQILDDIARLEGQRRSFILSMKTILRNQVDLLELLENDPLDSIREQNNSTDE
ncbi:septum site-determining protein DivIVA [bacterium BMS3Bbin04]|nr:septum site-determining protein DivIVA [bacterium BMS3Bbin04]